MDLTAGISLHLSSQLFTPSSIVMNRHQVQYGLPQVQGVSRHECLVEQNGGGPFYADNREAQIHRQILTVPRELSEGRHA